MKTKVIYLSIYFICLSAINGYAHEVNKAFFEIRQFKNEITVDTEFPWTLRDALIEFNPQLNKKGVTKIDFESTFIDYMNENLRLIGRDGDQIEAIGFTEIKNIGHAHQNNYTLTYDSGEIVEILNTTMFNIFDNQVNFSAVIIDDKTYSFKTYPGSEGVLLEDANHQSYWWLMILLPILLGLLIHLILQIRNQSISDHHFLAT